MTDPGKREGEPVVLLGQVMERPFEGGLIWAGSGRSPPCGESEGAEWEEGMGHRGLVTLESERQVGFFSDAVGKKPEGCSGGQ